MKEGREGRRKKRAWGRDKREREREMEEREGRREK